MQMMRIVHFLLIYLVAIVFEVVKSEDTATIITNEPITTTNPSQTTTTSSVAAITTQSPVSFSDNNQTTDLIEIFKNASRYCECDLTGNFCDLNCCCDEDCDLASKKLFSRCTNDVTNFRLLDSKYCYNRKIIYRNNTNYILERLTNVGGLFCIYTDNTKQQAYLMDKKIIKKLDELSALNLRAEFNWTIEAKAVYDLSTPELIDINQLGNQYRAGKEIYVINLKKIDQSNKQVKTLFKLTFSSSLVIRNGECNSQKKVSYLENFDSYCFKWIRNLQTDCVSGSAFDVNSYKLYLIGNAAQLTDNESSNQQDLNHLCIQHNCVPTDAEHTVKAISYRDQTCYNVVRSVHYKVVYNEKTGIQRVSVRFEFEDIKQTNNDTPIKQYQRFMVDFVHDSLLNQSMNNNITHYSGNLGYALEKPLIGQYLDRIENRTVALPFRSVSLQQDDDQCRVDSSNERIVSFGLNHRSGCLYDLESELKKNRSSWSGDICEQLNSQILRVFQQKTNADLIFRNHLSAYGKFNLSLTENWTPIINRTKYFPSTSSTSSILGTEILNNIKINCQLLKQLNYLFIYAMEADSREPQRKLISTTQTQVFHSFELCLNAFLCTNQAIELSTSIQFVQMKREKRMRYADSPAFKLELPEDFFYPFV